MKADRRPGHRRHCLPLAVGLAVVLTAAGCAAGAGTGAPEAPPGATVSASGPPEESAGSPSPQRPGGPEAPTPSSADPDAATQVSSQTDIPIRSTEPAAAEQSPQPVLIRYPEIEAELPVQPSGVSEDGQMEVPDDAAQAGWYKYGKAPADEEGSTVITAHAGSAETPVGPLYALTEAEPGDEVAVTDESGTEHRYQVTEIQQLGKATLDFTPYFERAGEHHLVLITCGGQWIPEQNSYAENIIVVAEPVD